MKAWAKASRASPVSFITRRLALDMGIRMYSQAISRTAQDIDRPDDRHTDIRAVATASISSVDNVVKVYNHQMIVRDSAFSIDTAPALESVRFVHVCFGADLFDTFLEGIVENEEEPAQFIMEQVKLKHGFAIKVFKRIN